MNTVKETRQFMDYKFTNEFGKVKINYNVISNIASHVIKKNKNIIQITNYKGKTIDVMNCFNKNSDANFIDIKMINNKLTLKVYLIVRFGSSLSKLTSNLIEELKQVIFENTGIEISKVIINVKGIKSKRVDKRNIFFEG